MRDYPEVEQTTKPVTVWRDTNGKLHDTRKLANKSQALINGDARVCVECDGTTRILDDEGRNTYDCQSCDSDGLQWPTWGRSK